MSGNDLTQIILALIGLAGALISAFLVPLIRSKTTKEERDFAEKVIREAVRAAEQIFNFGGQGEKKYAFVVEYVTSNYKLKLSAEELEVIIEAAVNELKENKEKI